MRVYVAGKLNDMACDYIKNVHMLTKCARRLRGLGFSVFVPSNDLIEGLIDGKFSYEDYFQNNIEWIEVSDVMFVCPYRWEDSEGVQKEIQYANENNIPVFFDIHELLEHKRKQKL